MSARGLVLLDEQLLHALQDDDALHELPSSTTSTGRFRLQSHGARGSLAASQGSDQQYAGLSTPRLSARTLGDYSVDRRPLPPHIAPDDSTVFSYPMLRRDVDTVSSTEGKEDDPHFPGGGTARLYAGTSSGLHISVRWILVGMVVGVALGVLLSQFQISSLAAQWVSLPGELFLRALKCLVVPYVFCSVAVAIGDIVFVGKVSVVGLQTAKVFGIMWVASVSVGMGVALLFRPLFRLNSQLSTPRLNAVGLTCANQLNAAVLPNGTVVCAGTGTTPFTFVDLQGTFQSHGKSGLAQLSLSDQLMQMITPIVSENIVASLANGQLLSVITFSMALGAIAGRQYFLRTRETNYLYLVLVQLRNTFFLAMEWTIWLSPGAVISIIAGSFAANQAALRQLSHVYAYVLAALCASLVQMLVVFPAIVLLLTHCNPYAHMRKMVRAYVFAFACSSSLATAPVTLTCVKRARVCSPSLANFVISIGVTSNISAAGTYFPVAVVFLAESSGNGDALTLLRIIGVFVLSLLSCSGTPPIPASGLVTITTIYETVFGVNVMPASFAYVVAMDFLLDRFATVCDVNDDIMALKVIAETTDETVTQEVLGERQ